VPVQIASASHEPLVVFLMAAGVSCCSLLLVATNAVRGLFSDKRDLHLDVFAKSRHDRRALCSV